ncbi:MAG: glycosyltransferase [Candidatus Latescibacterota bacterium]|nr:glycosyltransferase [Candidatus Latescibacterota bacterium]
MNLSIIIPAFNEERRILYTVDSVTDFLLQRDWSHEILVVDDGSLDRTAEVVEHAAARSAVLSCIRSPRNCGKGSAVRIGVGQAQGEVIGFIDADDKTDIISLDVVMNRIEAGSDGVIGDRTLRASDIAVPRRRYRQFGSDQFRRILRAGMGLGDFPDTQCGFKFFQGDVLRDLFRRQKIDGYMFDVEILLLAGKLGLKIDRIPVHWRDDPDSRFNPVSGSIRNFIELLRIRRLHH